MTPRFPDLDGRRLDGRAMRLPADLPATALLLVAFHQWHQRDVDAWLARVPAGVPAFEVPMLGGRWLPARRFIDGGMARSIADEVVLARTVTVYGQVGVVRDAFELADTELVGQSPAGWWALRWSSVPYAPLVIAAWCPVFTSWVSSAMDSSER
jgi:hypothetical protein